jgi:hypothetical protein
MERQPTFALTKIGYLTLIGIVIFMAGITLSNGGRNCRVEAKLNYNDSWDRTCERLGKGKDCTISNELAETLDRRYKDAKDMCFNAF